MLSTLSEFRDLPLRASAFSSFLEPGGQIRVLMMGEAVEPNVKLSALAAALFDRDGKVVGGWVAQPADLERSPVLGATTAPPGAYRLRVSYRGNDLVTRGEVVRGFRVGTTIVGT